MSGRTMWTAVMAALLTWTLTGCMTPMPLSGDNDKVEANKPIALLTVTLRNDFKPAFTPKLTTVSVSRNGGAQSADRFSFAPDEKSRHESRDLPDNTYYLRLGLEPGPYSLNSIQSLGQFFPISGQFFTYVLQDFRMPSSGVTYLGNISANVLPKQEGDVPAGAIIPLIDQAVSGAYTGTFDVRISDRSATDLSEFRKRFPALQSVRIDKAILPPFDRNKAKRHWNGG